MVEDFIKAHQWAVLATVTGNGLPQAAALGFFPKENFKLIFGTFDSSRKYHNLKANPNVALVIGWDKGVTVQYEGVAHEIESAEELHLPKVASAVKYISSYEERFFEITPKWIKYSDWSHDPRAEFEIRF
ncbi:MAG: hypothetical protein A2660_00905 [Candidatus Doudnabacteria bacterium RIFCSPHIGHO2_01_FULL_45_18]|uniref:Pyridoxamine 5'-phosphate oxidase N-terminal domain-containing protein n=1 Tax=Candidatus Doudnabacteria bacterium RIFCSPHIGHO2_01_FULL_45_18 TaxID=1817823 RepID=A0A1F5NS91_9BACT|nr:MAG: hypothetical protein A2660_00905 [Candidatus Doudnabacteria bacterium RIFCSPHIGHO2_01_FULL_45_18]